MEYIKYLPKKAIASIDRYGFTGLRAFIIQDDGKTIKKICTILKNLTKKIL